MGCHHAVRVIVIRPKIPARAVTAAACSSGRRRRAPARLIALAPGILRRSSASAAVSCRTAPLGAVAHGRHSGAACVPIGADPPTHEGAGHRRDWLRGSAVARALVAAGWQRPCPGARRLRSPQYATASSRQVAGDLADDRIARSRPRGLQALFHLAADYRLGALEPRSVSDQRGWNPQYPRCRPPAASLASCRIWDSEVDRARYGVCSPDRGVHVRRRSETTVALVELICTYKREVPSASRLQHARPPQRYVVAHHRRDRYGAIKAGRA